MDEPWIREVFASNMAYRARSRPWFPGDLQHDLRDHMHATHEETLSLWAGWVADKYLAAAEMAGLRDDPVADSLLTFDKFDARTLLVAHHHMAAHWRLNWMPRFLSGETPARLDTIPGASDSCLRGCPRSCTAVFRNWLRINVDYQALRVPLVIRRFCLVLVQQNTAPGIMAEIDLMESLRLHYPVPTMPPS